MGSSSGREPKALLNQKLYPKGPKDSDNGVVGLKYYHVNGIWDLKP